MGWRAVFEMPILPAALLGEVGSWIRLSALSEYGVLSHSKINKFRSCLLEYMFVMMYAHFRGDLLPCTFTTTCFMVKRD